MPNFSSNHKNKKKTGKTAQQHKFDKTMRSGIHINTAAIPDRKKDESVHYWYDTGCAAIVALSLKKL